MKLTMDGITTEVYPEESLQQIAKRLGLVTGKLSQDPLAAKLRERLKSDFGVVKNSKGKLGVDCVFSTEALVYPQSDGTVCAMKATAEGPKRMDCASGFGAATMVTATFGFVAVSHALKKMMAKAARQG